MIVIKEYLGAYIRADQMTKATETKAIASCIRSEHKHAELRSFACQNLCNQHSLVIHDKRSCVLRSFSAQNPDGDCMNQITHKKSLLSELHVKCLLGVLFGMIHVIKEFQELQRLSHKSYRRFLFFLWCSLGILKKGDM